MKFDVKLPSLNGIARIEIKTVQEENGWAAYLAVIYDRGLGETCLMLGQSGIPHRSMGNSEKEAEEAAKGFLQEKYKVVRTVW